MLDAAGEPAGQQGQKWPRRLAYITRSRAAALNRFRPSLAVAEQEIEAREQRWQQQAVVVSRARISADRESGL